MQAEVRPKRSGAPQLGSFVWHIVPGASPARVVADGFVAPSAVALSGDQQTLYVADAGYTGHA